MSFIEMEQMISCQELEIEDLRAENAALRAEVERLKYMSATEACALIPSIMEYCTQAEKQLAASQLEAKRLREVLVAVRDDLEIRMNMAEDDSLNISDSVLDQMLDAIDLSTSTDALDAYVSERVKQYRPEFYQMREMMRAMQSGELTVSRGIEILDMWWAGNWNDSMLPPVRQDLIEEDSMPVEIIDRLTRQRDLAVSAIENLVKQKGRHNTEIAYKKLVDVLAAIKESGATK